MVASQFVKNYLGSERVPKHEFDDLIHAVSALEEETETSKIARVLDWFRLLRKVEIEGWRTKEMTKKIAHLIFDGLSGKEVCFYALFCPSYKKGDGAFGFRTDGVGATTEIGINNLLNLYRVSDSMGIKCSTPLAIFFDIAVEQAEKVITNNCLDDLEINILNFRSKLPPNIRFRRISEYFPDIFSEIGYRGCIRDPLPIPNETFKRIVERGKKFYTLFDWTDNQIVERSKIIGTSESMVGERLRTRIPNGIMVYTPTMLERAAVYSGMKYDSDPLPIVFPEKDLSVWNKITLGS